MVFSMYNCYLIVNSLETNPVKDLDSYRRSVFISDCKASLVPDFKVAGPAYLRCPSSGTDVISGHGECPRPASILSKKFLPYSHWRA